MADALPVGCLKFTQGVLPFASVHYLQGHLVMPIGSRLWNTLFPSIGAAYEIAPSCRDWSCGQRCLT